VPNPVDPSLLVRPFVAGVGGVPRPQKASAKPPEPPKLTLKGGSAKVVTETKAGSTTVQWTYNDKKHSEVKRTFDVVRVKNPSDPSQYVDVEQMTKIDYALKGIPERERNAKSIELAKQPTADNIEVMQRNITRSAPE